jgi:outer membrane protein OmpA-like peptidoglycan-associated protein
MRILITGAVAFVIWCFISAWLYNDMLLPVLKRPVPVVAVSETKNNEADSLMKLKALMPADLLIFFEFNDAKFKPDPQTGSSIAPFKAWLDKYPGSKLYVTGHTDLVGTPEFNQALGQKRAQVITNYLVSLGIPASRIISESMGESKPAAEYITPEGRAKNRRAEITIKL